MELYRGDLYLTGDILNGQATFNWLHNEYLSAVYRYIELLKTNEEYTRICDVCRRASQIDDMDEQLHIELMQAMVNLNRPEEAAAEYRRLARQTRDYYDAEPGEELQLFYHDIAEAGKNIRFNLDIIRNELLEKEGYKPEKVAVELDLEIVPKAQYSSCILKDGSSVEVVSFVGGG